MYVSRSVTSPLYSQLAATFHTENVSIVTANRRTTFHMLNFSVSLVIFIQLKLRKFRTAVILIFHIL